jgi:hypothetical protein
MSATDFGQYSGVHPVRKSLCGYIELSDCAKVCRGFLRMLGEELLDDLVDSRSLQSSRIRAMLDAS